MKPHTYGPLIFDKGAKTIWWKKIAFSKNVAVSTGNQDVEECKSTHSYPQVQEDQGPQHKTRYTETNRKESGAQEKSSRTEHQ